jgi:hypothetical protein
MLSRRLRIQQRGNLLLEDAPVAFEAFAARIFRMHDQRVIIDEITRASVDGGRDAVGRYLLGLSNDPVYAEERVTGESAWEQMGVRW